MAPATTRAKRLSFSHALSQNSSRPRVVGVLAPAAAFVQATAAGLSSTRKGNVVDDYFGTKVPDPYRWMEDLDSKAVADWVKAQNAVTFAYLDQLSLRDDLKKRITELWNYPKVGTPFIEGGTDLLSKELRAAEAVAALRHGQRSTHRPTLVIDPNSAVARRQHVVLRHVRLA